MYSKSLARFKEDTANHELTVIEDTGTVRHMRFGEKGSPFYAVYITTFPGHLAITGDMGGYTFQRLNDMFEFFRGKGINPSYWGEKLEAEPRGSEYGKKWSAEAFKAAVTDYLQNNLDALEDLDEEEAKAQAELTNVIQHEIADITHKEEADEWSQHFDHNDFTFDGFYEYEQTEFTHHYLWVCHAIVEVIRQYDILNERSAA
jgi:hypothetical protein